MNFLISFNHVKKQNFNHSSNYFAEVSNRVSNRVSNKTRNYILNLKPEIYNLQKINKNDYNFTNDYNTSLDWSTNNNPKKKQMVTSVENQGQCGSCWAFSTLSALETNANIEHNTMNELSAQTLLNCNSYNYTCKSGGVIVNAMQFIIKNGIESLDDYYRKDNKCNYIKATQFSNYYRLPSCNEEVLKNYLKFYSIIVSINANCDTFMSYKGGIMREPCKVNNTCSYNDINHAMHLVGYNKDEKQFCYISIGIDSLLDAMKQIRKTISSNKI